LTLRSAAPQPRDDRTRHRKQVTLLPGADNAPIPKLHFPFTGLTPCLSWKTLGGSFFLALAALALSLAPLRWAGAGVAGAILAVAILLQPALGLIALGLVVPFGSILSFPSASVGMIDGLVALVIAGWLVLRLAARRLTVNRIPLLWPLVAFLWFGAMSLLHAASWQQGVLEWLKWAEFAVVYLVAASTLQRKHVRWVLISLFAAAVFEVGLGAYQFSRQVGPEAFAISSNFTRAYGTLQQPNPYAGYLGYLMPVALSLTIGVLARWRNSGMTTSLVLGLLLAIVTLALLVGIGLSWSRGAWLGAVAGVLIVIAGRNRRWFLICSTLVLTLMLLLVVLGPTRLPSEVSQRVTAVADYFAGPDPATVEITDQNFSVLERIAHWQAGLAMFDSAPWTGVGIGNYAAAYPRFALPHWYDPLGHAHNLYINFLAETGILGALAFLTLWVSAAVFACRQARAEDALLRSLALGVLGTIVYLSVHNFFDNLFVQHLQLQLALLLGTMAALAAAPTRSSM
jgi:O-antigen ligase